MSREKRGIAVEFDDVRRRRVDRGVEDRRGQSPGSGGMERGEEIASPFMGTSFISRPRFSIWDPQFDGALSKVEL